MSKLIISTESCSDLSEEMQKKHNIYVVPMHIVMEDETYPDGSKPVQYIYDYYDKTKKTPKTSAVNPDEFIKFFEKIEEENPDCDIVHISYSSKASCTYQNCAIALEEGVHANVHLIDSLNVSAGVGNLTMLAVELREQYPEISAEELVAKIEALVPKITTSFVPDTLDYLVAGGRVSNAAALGAAILRLKPRIDIINGELIATRKYRGSMKRVMMKLVEDFIANENLSKEYIYIMHTEQADEEVVQEMTKALQLAGFATVKKLILGSVMTAHGGKGAIGMTGLKL